MEEKVTRADIKADTETLVHEVVVNPTNADLQIQIDTVHDRLDAIDKSLKDILTFMKNVNIGTGIFKWSWNNSAKIGSITVFLIGLTIFFKAGIAAAMAFIFGNKL